MAYCTKCGNEIKDSVKYCPKCGEISSAYKVIKKAIDGDQVAISQIYESTYKKAYSVAMQLLKNEDNVMDILQDSYIVLLNKLDTLENPARLNAWFNMIVSNKCKDFFRKKNPALFSEMGNEEDDLDYIDTIENENIAFSPEENADYNETKRLMNEILQGLSDEQKMCVLMYYYEEMSVTEIAESLDVSTNTVKSRLNYARKKIKIEVEELEKKGTKLYGIAPIPFIIWMLTQGEKEVSASVLNTLMHNCGFTMAQTSATATTGVADTVASETASKMSTATADATVKTVAKTAATETAKTAVTKAIATKIIAGVVALSVIGGGAYIGMKYTKKDKQKMANVTETISNLDNTETTDNIPETTEEQIVGYKVEYRNIENADENFQYPVFIKQDGQPVSNEIQMLCDEFKKKSQDRRKVYYKCFGEDGNIICDLDQIGVENRKIGIDDDNWIVNEYYFETEYLSETKLIMANHETTTAGGFDWYTVTVYYVFDFKTGEIQEYNYLSDYFSDILGIKKEMLGQTQPYLILTPDNDPDGNRMYAMGEGDIWYNYYDGSYGERIGVPRCLPQLNFGRSSCQRTLETAGISVSKLSQILSNINKTESGMITENEFLEWVKLYIGGYGYRGVFENFDFKSSEDGLGAVFDKIKLENIYRLFGGDKLSESKDEADYSISSGKVIIKNIGTMPMPKINIYNVMGNNGIFTVYYRSYCNGEKNMKANIMLQDGNITVKEVSILNEFQMDVQGECSKNENYEFMSTSDISGKKVYGISVDIVTDGLMEIPNEYEFPYEINLTTDSGQIRKLYHVGDTQQSEEKFIIMFDEPIEGQTITVDVSIANSTYFSNYDVEISEMTYNLLTSDGLK